MRDVVARGSQCTAVECEEKEKKIKSWRDVVNVARVNFYSDKNCTACRYH